MSGSSWSLVIPVLAVGLAIGAVWVVLWSRRRSQQARAGDRDRRLLLADLEARQELLYEQMREADTEEREALELAAARNLKAIDEAGGRSGEPGRDDAAAVASDAAATPLPAPAGRAPSAWLGFVGGVACAALIGLLVVWAQRDARPRPEEPGAAPMTADEAHPEGPPLSEREREALAQLALMIDNDPTNLMARKQYAVGLLSTGRFMAAFEQAEVLLGSNPTDPDGLYVKGMVRMRMGQEEEARSLLDKVLVDYPDHVPALTALGVIALRSGGLPEAEEYWAKAEEYSGGQSEEIERLRAAAREQFGAPGSVDRAAQAAPVAPRTRAPVAPAAPGAAPPPSGPAFTLEIDLGSGASVPRSSVLFISLRPGPSGPPTAVKRVDNPRLPMTVVLTAADAMMGQPLPEAGTVFARLDVDGSASTRQEGEPTAEVQMRAGETARLTLE